MTTSPSPADAVRIQVIRHCSADGTSQCCRFSVDPQLTTLSVLHNLVARAFKLSAREFETSYLARDERLPEAVWLPLLSDFDLELAFSRSSEPHLLVKVELGRSGSMSSTSSWEGLELVPRLPHITAAAANTYSAKLPGIFRQKMEKTIGLMQRALNWPDEITGASSDGRLHIEGMSKDVTFAPMDDVKFQSFLDNVGVLVRVSELRKTIYMAGLEPSLRKVVWKHLLDVYPAGLSGKERLEYMKGKTQEYHALRGRWQQHLQHAQQVCEEVETTSNMVRKDVLRTDRQHPYFSGRDDNPNTTALFNILTTYALNHPSVGYCQGMSDLASPLLVTQRDEAHAYVCFCALMSRVHPNFHIDGVAMSLKFQHLTEALIFYDPDFFLYLQEHQADDLLFCYRWLLLELKREFVFDDAQLMLEVLWASLPPRPPAQTLPLAEVAFDPEAVMRAAKNAAALALEAPTTALPALASARLLCRVRSERTSNYSAVCALRRQRSSEAALLSRRSSSRQLRLNRTVSQPVKSYTNGAADVSEGSVKDSGSSSTKDAVSSRGKFSAVSLSPLSDEVFTSEASVNNCSNEASRVAEAGMEPEVTPTRKIKNLKEFMELAKGSKSSTSKSDQGSLNRSPGRNEKVSPQRISSEAARDSRSPSKLGSPYSGGSKQSPNRSLSNCTKPISASNGPVCEEKISSCDRQTNETKCLSSGACDSSELHSNISSSENKCLSEGMSNAPQHSFCRNSTNFASSKSQTGSPCKSSALHTSRACMTSLSTNSSVSEISAHDTSSYNSSSSPQHSDETSIDCYSLGGSSTSSVLCAAETSRRCFSESDAALGLLNDGGACVDEELCVEVWENPVASSPVRPPIVSLRTNASTRPLATQASPLSSTTLSSVAPSPKTTLSSNTYSASHSCTTSSYGPVRQCLPNSHTDGDVAKLLKDDSTTSNGLAQATLSPTNTASPSSGQTSSAAETSGGWTVGVGGVGLNGGSLPPPHEFGGGNPFLMIVCVSILLQHRDSIISQQLDHNDLAMHFDKLMRKHDVHSVLRDSRRRYRHYCSLSFGKPTANSHEQC